MIPRQGGNTSGCLIHPGQTWDTHCATQADLLFCSGINPQVQVCLALKEREGQEEGILIKALCFFSCWTCIFILICKAVFEQLLYFFSLIRKFAALFLNRVCFPKAGLVKIEI